MGYSKDSFNREVHSDKYLRLRKKEDRNKQYNYTSRN